MRVLRWAADNGPAVLRPVPCPASAFGHAYGPFEERFKVTSCDAVRVLEDLADYGVLSRSLANRVHLCPQCRRWTINFRETCPSCSSLDVDVEGMIHHFACAYVGLDSEYRQGMELRCPKCGKGLRHIGLDYERPRQAYVCRGCGEILDDPTVTAQCLDCRWEGLATEVHAHPVYAYELTARGHEAVERGELRGLKLREMVRTSRFDLASREFLELEIERETFRLSRYRRPMSILLCRFVLDGRPFALFRELDQDTLKALAAQLVASARSLDVVALADAATIAVLLPETNQCSAHGALARFRDELSGQQIEGPRGCPLDQEWTVHCWHEPPRDGDTPLLWFQQQLQQQPDEA